MKSWVVTGGLLAALLAAAWVIRPPSRVTLGPPTAAGEVPEVGLTVGRLAPELDGETPDGRRVRLSDYRGKAVLIDFWATWCGPCRMVAPHIKALAIKLSGRPFAVLGVNTDRSRENVEAYLAKSKPPGETILDGGGGDNAERYRVNAIPLLILVDAKGVIRARDFDDLGQLEKMAEVLVREAEAAK